MKMLIKFCILLVAITSLATLIGCGEEPEIVEEETEVYYIEKVHEFNNCNRNSETTHHYTAQNTISHIANWEVEGKVGADATVPIPGLPDFGLHAALSKKYSQSESETLSDEHKIDIRVEPNYITRLVTFWTVTHKKGYVDYYGTKISFDYPEKMEFEDSQIVDMSCDVIIIDYIMPMGDWTENPNAAKMLGKWKNIEAPAIGIVNMDISQEDDALVFRVIGDDETTTANWPIAKVHISSKPIQVVFPYPYKNTTLTILMYEDELLFVTMEDDYRQSPIGAFTQTKEFILERP